MNNNHILKHTCTKMHLLFAIKTINTQFEYTCKQNITWFQQALNQHSKTKHHMISASTESTRQTNSQMKTNNEYIMRCIRSLHHKPPKKNKKTMNTSCDASGHTATNDGRWTDRKETRSHVSGVAKRRLIVHLKQRVTCQGDTMKGWHDERSKTKPLKKIQFSSLRSSINEKHLLISHSISANPTVNIVIYTTAYKIMSKPHNQHQESKLGGLQLNI